MIQEGLYNMLVNASAIQALLPSSGSPAVSQAYKCVHFVRAPKEPLTPFIIVHLPDVPPAEATLADGVSSLIEAMIQFDSYAPEKNGALLARQLSRAIRDLCVGNDTTPSPYNPGPGTLSDGTTISFCEVLADFDDNYEVGGTSFLFRSVLRLKAFYTEGPNTI